MTEQRSAPGGKSAKTFNRQSFTRGQRLLKPEQFARVFKKNQRSRDKYFVVLARRNQLPYARLGMAISRKAAGDAVPRNRLKRLVRESFRRDQQQLPNVDVVVMANAAAAGQRNPTLYKSLEQHWSQVAKRCKK